MPSPSCVTLSCETNLVKALAMTSPLFPSHEPARADRHPSSSFYSSAAPPLPSVDFLPAVLVFHTIGRLPNIAIFLGIDNLPIVGLCYVHDEPLNQHKLAITSQTLWPFHRARHWSVNISRHFRNTGTAIFPGIDYLPIMLCSWRTPQPTEAGHHNIPNGVEVPRKLERNTEASTFLDIFE